MTVSVQRRPLAGGSYERRAEIGRERRDRTRKQMMVASARLIALRGTEGVTIEDFIRAAGVARGTFYNYFQTREQLISTLWRHFGRTRLSKILRITAADPDPASRLVSGMRLSIRKAADDHTWGWLLFRLTAGDPGMNEDLRSFPLRDIRAGMAMGRFAAEDPEIACDYFIGIAMMAIKAVLIGERPEDYAERCAFLTLRGLGLAASDAQEVATRPMSYVLP